MEDVPTPALAPNASAEPPPYPQMVDDGVFYPCSDGRPMAENMWQAEAIMAAAGDIRVARPQALVAADILVYPEQGNPRVNIAPDVLVAFGLGHHKRSSYLVWREGKPPDWVLEVASPSTASRDLEIKRRRYAEMGVTEYWLFDPTEKLFRRRGEAQLQGYALAAGRYQPLPAMAAGGMAMIRSDVLRLGLRAENELIRLRDLETGKDVLHRDEAEADRARETALRRAADARVAEADARVAELEALLQRQREESHGNRT